MARSVYLLPGRSRFNFTTAQYYPLTSHWGAVLANESQRRINIPNAGDFRDLQAEITANTLNNVFNLTLRKNGSDTALAISVPASTTGSYTDADQVSIAVDDEVTIEHENDAASSGSITVFNSGAVFNPSNSETVTHLIRAGGGNSSASPVYESVHGRYTNTTTESLARSYFPEAGTLKYFSLRWDLNNRTGTTDSTLRKNGVDTSVSFSVPGGVTGEFTDLSTTITVAAGDYFTWRRDYISGTGLGTPSYISMYFISTTDDQLFLGYDDSGAVISSTTPLYFHPSGGDYGSRDTTESDAQMAFPYGGTINSIGIYVSTNSRNGTTTYRTRKNGANGNLLISIPSSSTGRFTDTTPTDTVAAGDDIALQLTVGGASGSFVFRAADMSFTPETLQGADGERSAEIDGVAPSTANGERSAEIDGEASGNFLAGWGRRKLMTIDGSIDGALTDYVVPVVVNFGSGSDSGRNVYTGSLCRADFGDIRFTSADGLTELSYYLDQFISSDKALFWVKIPSIPADPSTVGIYVYYQNASATTTSSGDNTFESFEDFEDTSYIFDLAGSTGISIDSVSSHSPKEGADVGVNNGSQGYKKQLDSSQSFDDGFRVEVWAKILSGGGTNENLGAGISIFGATGGVNDGYESLLDGRGAVSPQIREAWDYGTRNDGNFQVSEDTWYLMTLYVESGVIYADLYTETQAYTGTPQTTTSRADTTYTSGFAGISTYSANHTAWDAFRVRKHTPNSPTVSAWGSEETPGAGSTETDDERSGEIHGSDTANAIRDAEVDGQDTANTTRSAEVDGADSANTIRDAEVDGVDTAQSERSGEIHGSVSDNAIREAEVDGADSANAIRDAEIDGINTANALRETEIHGELSDSAIRSAELDGQDTSTAERSAEVDGAQGATAERGAEIDGYSDAPVLTAVQNEAVVDLTWTYNE